MGKRRGRVLRIAGYGLLALHLAGCAGGGPTVTRIQETNNARVGTVPFEPPLLYQAGTELLGPDAELAHRIVERIQESSQLPDQGDIKLTWAHRNHYGNLVPALLKNEIDFIVGVFAITEDRQEEIIFSDPYFTSELVILVNPVHRDINRSTLGQAKIGVRQGTGVEGFVTREKLSSQIELFETLDDAVLALRRGEVDAVIDDRLMAAYSLAMTPGSGHLEMIPEVLGTLDCAVGIKWRDTALLKLVNEVIGELKEAGQFAQWIQEHAGEHVAAVESRRAERLEKERRADDPRQITIRVSKSRDFAFDIYKMANLRFVLTQAGSGETSQSSRIQFQGRTATAKASVPPGTYKLALPQYNFATSLEITTRDPEQVPVDIRLTRSGVEVRKGGK